LNKIKCIYVRIIKNNFYVIFILIFFNLDKFDQSSDCKYDKEKFKFLEEILANL